MAVSYYIGKLQFLEHGAELEHHEPNNAAMMTKNLLLKTPFCTSTD